MRLLLSLDRVRTCVAVVALGVVLLAPAGAQAQRRVPLLLPARDSSAAQPSLHVQFGAQPTPSERLAQRGPVWGTSGDLSFMALGAAILYGAYRLKESDHPFLAAYTGIIGGLSFFVGFTDLIDTHRYPAPAPRDTAAAW
ncbi:hypothetical protein [Longimicrobium sp.]|uniref:hypothetical protein n=1 Tax=Longimicrobium sp. TaxID=2029185 RepID=UPI002EDB86AE